MKKLSENRLNHSYAVAQKCYVLAKEHGMSEDKAKAAFVMGLLHDIGYAAEEGAVSAHTYTGADMVQCLVNHHQEIIDAISGHGIGDLDTMFALVLNEADMTTGVRGTDVSYDERIHGIEVRYGKDSIQAQNAREMRDKLDNAWAGNG